MIGEQVEPGRSLPHGPTLGLVTSNCAGGVSLLWLITCWCINESVDANFAGIGGGKTSEN